MFYLHKINLFVIVDVNQCRHNLASPDEPSNMRAFQSLKKSKKIRRTHYQRIFTVFMVNINILRLTQSIYNIAQVNLYINLMTHLTITQKQILYSYD